MKNLIAKFGFFSVAAVIAALLFLTPAEAHEKREVAGKYQFIVGFLNEPAYSGEMNAATFKITESTGRNDAPVLNLENSLTAKVISEDGKEMELKLRRLWNQPGVYAGYFLPTRAGKYVFQISGKIGDMPVDEKFESGQGPNHFDSVQNSESLRFPDRVVGDISQVIEQDEKGSKLAFWIGLAGIIVGLAALMLAGVSMVFRTNSANSLKH